MADEGHLEIFGQGVDAWNKWRKENPAVRPDLTGEDFGYEDLNGVDLGGVDLSYMYLSGTTLIGANFTSVRTLYGAGAGHPAVSASFAGAGGDTVSRV